MFENDSRSSLRKWIFAALLAAAGVLLSPVFSFPLGVTRAFPLQHMINIFLAVLECGNGQFRKKRVRIRHGLCSLVMPLPNVIKRFSERHTLSTRRL